MLDTFAHVDVASTVATVCTRTAVCLWCGTASLMPLMDANEVKHLRYFQK